MSVRVIERIDIIQKINIGNQVTVKRLGLDLNSVLTPEANNVNFFFFEGILGGF